ncbi:MAG: ferritin-like domain-containing protein [Chloroflexota bacterium]
MEKKELIAILNQDLESEHGAIIQYLTHAYAMGEGEVSCEIEALAREEMRHLDWLAETIVELGGTPSLKRGNMRMSGAAPSDWMQNNVLLEEDAIGPYREQVKTIGDPKIKRLIQRILSDEEAHHLKFAHLVDKVKKEGMTDRRGTRDDHIAQELNWGIEHEYTVILQYLLQSYLTPNEEAKKELEDQAINEMQHLGWLAEEMVDGKGNPRIEHGTVNTTPKLAEGLRADIKIEEEVARRYDQNGKEAADEDLKRLLFRLRDHELYHAALFKDLLKEEK